MGGLAIYKLVVHQGREAKPEFRCLDGGRRNQRPSAQGEYRSYPAPGHFAISQNGILYIQNPNGLVAINLK